MKQSRSSVDIIDGALEERSLVEKGRNWRGMAIVGTVDLRGLLAEQAALQAEHERLMGGPRDEAALDAYYRRVKAHGAQLQAFGQRLRSAMSAASN